MDRLSSPSGTSTPPELSSCRCARAQRMRRGLRRPHLSLPPRTSKVVLHTDFLDSHCFFQYVSVNGLPTFLQFSLLYFLKDLGSLELWIKKIETTHQDEYRGGVSLLSKVGAQSCGGRQKPIQKVRRCRMRFHGGIIQRLMKTYSWCKDYFKQRRKDIRPYRAPL